MIQNVFFFLSTKKKIDKLRERENRGLELVFVCFRGTRLCASEVRETQRVKVWGTYYNYGVCVWWRWGEKVNVRYSSRDPKTKNFNIPFSRCSQQTKLTKYFLRKGQNDAIVEVKDKEKEKDQNVFFFLFLFSFFCNFQAIVTLLSDNNFALCCFCCNFVNNWN